MSTGLTLSIPTSFGMPAPSMDHPQSPPIAHMQDGHNPTSPPEHHYHHPDPSVSMGYRPPPPGYGAPPPSYSHYSPYGPPQGGGYGGGPPPHSYPPHGSHAPGSYPPPPHAHTSYGYGYPPARTPYGGYGGYEGSYPAQQTRTAPPPPYRSSHAPPTRQAPPPQQAPQQRHPSPQKGSPTSMTEKTSPQRSMDPPMRSAKATDHVEVERLRAVAATEISHVEVKPIRTDFHFFVQTHKEKYLKEANDEVRKSSKTPEGEKLDVFLVNTNLNTRLMKAWEDLTKEERDEYMVMEEEDRRRFMEEDEIASRHCATLTARGKSPRASDKSKKEEQREESETHLTTSPDRESPNRKGGLPKDEDDEGNEEDDDEEGPESDSEEGADGVLDDESATHEVGSPKKRLSPPTKVDTSSGAESSNESPSKRNRGTVDV